MPIDSKEGPVFPGIWPGKIVELDDSEPSRRVGKCRVDIPDVYGDKIPRNRLPWAYPLFPGYIDVESQSGFFMMPPVGATVGILFERGDPNAPRWVGGWSKKGGLPYPFQNSEGDKFPHISCWRGPDGMMIRFVAGERLEIYLGKSGSFNEDGKFESDGEHAQHETSIVLDKKRKKLSLRSKYGIDVRCQGRITVRAPQIRVQVIPNQRYNSESEEWEKDPESPETFCDLSVFDPDVGMGSRIKSEPGKLTGQARHVKGFEDR